MFKRIVTGKAFLCGELTFGVLANTKSANLVPFPQDSLLIRFSPAQFFLQISAPHLTSTTPVLSSGPSLSFHLSTPKQKKGFVVTRKNLLMLNQKNVTSLRGIFNV